MRWREAMAVAAVALLAAGAGHAAAPTPTGPHPCPGASGFTCSTLAVPLDHSGPRQTGTLHLNVAAADNTKASRGVLLVLTGGPGQPGVPYVAKIAKALAGVLPDYRLVMYDQRGTGSGALDCPALQSAMGASDLAAPPAAAVRACARALGSARSLYGTDDVVADMELLPQALGADTWTLDGISYGTYVAERYAIAHPSRVKRLVLDSVVPHNFDFELVPLELRAAARVLRLVCGQRCVNDLTAVVRARHNGVQILDALTLMSVVDPGYRMPGDIAAALHSARGGDLVALDALLATIRNWEAAPAEALSQGLHASALCGDWHFPWGDASAPLAGREAKVAQAAARLRASDVAPFDR